MMYITRDDFVWLDVTSEIKNGELPSKELYAVYDDDSESLLESTEEVNEALEIGVRICIEVGHIPKQNNKWFHSADKILKDGYWYVKINDLKLGNV